MKKWEIINETSELKATTKASEIIDKFFESGIGNGTTAVIANVETLEEARKLLADYRCTSRIMSTVRMCDFYYAAEVEYDEDYDEWEQTGNYEFAEIEADD